MLLLLLYKPLANALLECFIYYREVRGLFMCKTDQVTALLINCLGFTHNNVVTVQGCPQHTYIEYASLKTFHTVAFNRRLNGLTVTVFCGGVMQITELNSPS